MEIVASLSETAIPMAETATSIAESATSRLESALSVLEVVTSNFPQVMVPFHFGNSRLLCQTYNS